MDDLYDSSDLYSIFSTLPTFLYVILGNIILLFIIELIVHYKKTSNGCSGPSGTSDSKKRVVFCKKVFVVGEILAVLGLFT